jgi:hypothetical protein
MNADDILIYLIFTAQNKLRTYLNNTMTADGVKVTVAQSGILFLLKAISPKPSGLPGMYCGSSGPGPGKRS